MRRLRAHSVDGEHCVVLVSAAHPLEPGEFVVYEPGGEIMARGNHYVQPRGTNVD